MTGTIHQALRIGSIEAAVSPAAFTPRDMRAKGLDSVLRLSPGHDTPWEDIRRAVDIVGTMVHA